ncbi:hypothetical protein [Streptomyces erythrochromogenes]|uniref:hypothetical protein n=1 Tax=Streptomyces erythrochromogenes TaxID=285574 RepID=UPI00369A1155
MQIVVRSPFSQSMEQAMHWSQLFYEFLLHDVLGNTVAALFVTAGAWTTRRLVRRSSNRRTTNRDSTDQP